MPTSKKRINISVPTDIEEILKILAKQGGKPIAAIALHLIEVALEIEEDAVWAEIADERDQPGVKYISHEQMWHDL